MDNQKKSKKAKSGGESVNGTLARYKSGDLSPEELTLFEATIKRAREVFGRLGERIEFLEQKYASEGLPPNILEAARVASVKCGVFRVDDDRFKTTYDLGQLSLPEICELIDTAIHLRDFDAAKPAAKTPNAGINKPPEAPFLGLVFHHDSTVSRLGVDYEHLPPITLARQPLTLLKYIHDAGSRGRTVGELVPGIVETKRILATEKNRLDLSEIDIDLGEKGQYVVRCTKQK